MSVFVSSETAAAIGIGIFFSIVAAKTYDAIKNKDVIDALKEVIKADGILDATKNYIKAVDIVMDATIPGNRLSKTVFVTINSSLLVSLSLITKQATDASNNTKKSKTIVGMMLGEKIKNSSRSQIYLVLAYLINATIWYFSPSSISGFVLFVVAVGISIIHIDHKLIEYRIRHGWYGNNAFESREIINFIISHANKDDFNDSGGLKKVVPLPSIQEDSGTAIEGATV